MVPPTFPAEQKAALRAGLRATRARFVAAFAPAGRIDAEARVAATLARECGGAVSIAFYLAAGCELALGRALDALSSAGVATLLPRLGSVDGAIAFARWRPGDPLETGPFGLRQPPADAPVGTPDTILLPLVGFDRAGGRLGQGGGFYDRALAACSAARRIGVGWSVQEVRAVPLEPWDMRLDAIVTEQEWITT